MSKKKKKNRKLKSFLRKAVINVFQDFPGKIMNYKQIAAQLNITDKQIRKSLVALLNEMSDEGILTQHQRGKYSMDPTPSEVIGTIEITNSGMGFVLTDEGEDDIKIASGDLNTAFDGDLVKVDVIQKRKGKPSGRVVEIVERNKKFFVGTIDISEKYAFVIPDNKKIKVDFYIDKKHINGAEDGQKVIVELLDWPDPNQSPFGRVSEVLGSPGSNETEILAILAEHDLPRSFPKSVVKEAESFSINLDSEEIQKRKDFRSTTTFTIDPDDAKDFDDALSFKALENGHYEVGIHIADVSHYVTPNTALDQEAFYRGNSVYLVDRVIPMLPEQLSNLVCSLRPQEEKFVFSAVFELDNKGKVFNQWFGKGVINSDHRFAYEDALKIIEGEDGPFQEEILVLHKIAQNLRKKRIKNGALEISSEEIKFKVDAHGKPIGIIKKIQNDANKLIEEFMLLANKKVARFVSEQQTKGKAIPFIYRIHDTPDMGKLEVFKMFVSKFGHQISFNHENEVASKMNGLLEKVKGTNEFDMIQQMAIKSMAKAEYSTKNIGHYGLHFEHYTHFTSPIRRYADLIVHRILFDILEKVPTPYNKNLNEVAKQTSRMERKAVEAERDSNKFFQALFMEDKVGGIFDAVITGITSWGIYARIEEFACEGMIALDTISDDHYYYDEKNYRIIGSSSKNEYNLGDKITIQVVRVDTLERKIDFEFPLQ